VTGIRTTGSALGTAVLIVLSACSSDSSSPSDSISPAPSTTSSPEQSRSATDAPDDKRSNKSSEPRSRLLSAGQLPGLNAQQRWTVESTRRGEGPESIWICQVTQLRSIGATGVRQRSYADASGGDPTAQTAIVTFADEQSARYAYAVLVAWHDRCEETLGGDHRLVRADEKGTPIDAGRAAQWRLVSYGPVRGQRDAAYIDATGYAQVGRRLVLMTMTSIGQDYNHPPGAEPIVTAVRRAAGQF